MSGTRIDPTGVRLSTNLTIDRQTPKSDFGDRVQAGLNTATGAVANGLAVAAPVVPGASILSAAVSSLGTVSGGGAGGAGGAMGAQYASGVISLGGGSSGGTLSTTVGGSGGLGVGGLGGGTVGGLPNPAQVVGGTFGNVGTGMLNQANGGLSDQAGMLGQMLQVQMQMQRENQVFTTVSNVLKTRHDTIKNTIQNVH